MSGAGVTGGIAPPVDTEFLILAEKDSIHEDAGLCSSCQTQDQTYRPAMTETGAAAPNRGL